MPGSSTQQQAFARFIIARNSAVFVPCTLLLPVIYLIRSIFWSGGRPLLAVIVCGLWMCAVNQFLLSFAIPQIRQWGPAVMGVEGYTKYVKEKFPALEKHIGIRKPGGGGGSGSGGCTDEGCKGCGGGAGGAKITQPASGIWGSVALEMVDSSENASAMALAMGDEVLP